MTGPKSRTTESSGANRSQVLRGSLSDVLPVEIHGSQRPPVQ